jgi:hypothetical protein
MRVHTHTHTHIYRKQKTFIPGIWTHSRAVPVAFARNSDKVSSAIERSLKKKTMILVGWHTNKQAFG